MDVYTSSDQAILVELGQRFQRHRLNRNITQAQLAKDSGVSRTVVQRLERGDGCTLESLVKLLRALNLLDELNSFLPEPGYDPVALWKMQGNVRERASGYRKSTDDGDGRE